MEWLNNLEPTLRVFWLIAIPASLIFLIQTVLTFTGVDAGDGLEADFDSDLSGGDSTFQLFSLRNLINFLLGLGWTGVAFYTTVANKTLLILLSIAVGVLFVYLFFVVIRQLQKLAQNNSFRITDALHQTAEVYLTIPGNRSGHGKVLVSVKGSVHELKAITNGSPLPSGAAVKITGVEQPDLLLVEPLS
jgi:hypothetical protein